MEKNILRRIIEVHNVEEQVMSELNRDKVYLVTGVLVALDEEDGVLIAGILSDSPFKDNEQPTSTGKKIGHFAFTRRQAKFLRDRINEFLKE